MLTLSLKWRIGIYTAVVLLIAIGAISLIAFGEFKESMIDSLDYRLESDIRAIQNIILEEKTLASASGEIKAFLNTQANSGKDVYKIWFEGDNEQITNDENIESLLLQIIEANPVVEWEDHYFSTNIVYNEKSLRVIWARYPIHLNDETSAQELNIFISIDASFARHEMAEFLNALLIITGIVVWAGIGGLFIALRWGLRPLKQMTEKMEHISGHSLEDLGMNSADTVKELRPFVVSWQQMLKRLLTATEKNKRFTADASHELRTPLAVIKSTLQLARSQKRTAEIYEKAIDESLEDIDRINRLMDKLLELSRLDYSLSSEKFKFIHMEQLVKGVIVQFEPIAQNSGKTLQENLCPASINGDEIQLVQMLVNLIDNAIRYSPERSTITVSMEKNETCLKIIFHDEGGLITLQQQSRIFDRFYRIDKARDRKSGGTGLGLSIAYEIARQHGGAITVSSSPETGTNFSITLPVIKVKYS